MTIHTVPFSIQSLLDADLRDMPRRARSKAEAVALVMPCYNEAKRLDAPRIVNFVIANPNVTLILVNDGSKDDTLSMALAMQALAPAQITVLDLAKNGGKAEAVRQGLCHALTTDAPLVAYWDADLATPLDAVEDFARIAQRDPSLEVIFGSRRQMLGHRIRRTLSRRVISRLCASMARMALGMPVADTQCGAKMLRATPALRAAVAAPFTAGWLFDVELFARLVKGRPEGGTRSPARKSPAVRS
jgi:dolichyl-phosphate beta-glucosyltransferase